LAFIYDSQILYLTDAEHALLLGIDPDNRAIFSDDNRYLFDSALFGVDINHFE
jgi:hypothetical protein